MEAASHPVVLAAADRQVAHPSPDSDLSRGVLVETSILARLFGLKLLTLEGTVVISPARLGGAPDGDFARSVVRADPRERPGRSTVGSRNGVQPAGLTLAAPIGARLVAAEQLLAESAEIVEQLQELPRAR